MLKIGSHVGMSGKKMMLGSVEEALSYGANTFMIYTGAPQNTRRKEISELNIDAAHALMKENGIDEFIIHAPYIINLANTVKPETYELAVNFLRLELTRADAMGSNIMVLHPGAHVGAGVDAGIASIVKGLNEVLTDDTNCMVALETMAGIAHFDQVLGKDQIAAFHINDSKNPRGAAKDRHENLGKGCIGFDALNHIVHHPDFADVPKILETPWIPIDGDKKNTRAPYKEEIAMLRASSPAVVPE